MSKVILIMSDALRYDVARSHMGFLGHLVETKQATLYKIIGELPSMSRPMYETIHTGMPTSEHGIVANTIVRRSTMPNIFQCVVEAGKVTAAVAYYWVSELYNRAPFDWIDDKEVDDEKLLVQHGRFHRTDDYPDEELFASAALLVRRFSPDYLLLHPVMMDYTGETYGSDSSQYRRQAIKQDVLLGTSSWNGGNADTPSSSRAIMGLIVMDITVGLRPSSVKCRCSSSRQMGKAKAIRVKQSPICILRQRS